MTALHLLTPLLILATAATGEYLRADLVVAPDGRTGAMHFFRFNASTTSLKIIPRGNFRNLAEAMKAHNCIGGSNGGFFDPQFQPLGEVIASGQKSGRPNLASSLTSGVLYQKGNTIAIERSKTFYAAEKTANQLLQTGPFLIENSRPVAGLSNRRFARRTFIATDGKGNWILAYTPPTTLFQLAQSLAKSESNLGLKIKVALNLDGGSSSALWIHKGNDNNPLYLKEFKPVSNYIGIVRK